MERDKQTNQKWVWDLFGNLKEVSFTQYYSWCWCGLWQGKQFWGSQKL